MRLLVRSITFGVAMLVSTSSFAAPNMDAWLTGQVGVNHRIGDAGFVARFGRMPNTTDNEHARMVAHLAHVRRLLGDASATSEATAAMRARLLGHLDEYIAHGVTPENDHFGFRTPVFIDDAGRICAVGYLIEQTAGRALAEDIARTHRYAELELLYAERADVRAWVAASGFSLAELASIQPGYIARIDDFHLWAREGGKVSEESKLEGLEGSFVKGQMEGAWTLRTKDGTVRGKGTFHEGNGHWRSLDAGGHTMGEGPYVANVPHGAWRLYHPSGRLAAEGAFVNGRRDGRWTFYQDAPDQVPIARGSFKNGGLRGRWTHYDEHGALLAIYDEAIAEPMRPFGTLDDDGTSGIAHLLTVTPGADGVSHSRNFAMHYMNTTTFALDMFARGHDKLFVHTEPVAEPTTPESWEVEPVMKDVDGKKLTRSVGPDGAPRWSESVCPFSGVQRAAARVGDIVTLNGTWVTVKDHYLRDKRTEGCGPATAMSAAQARAFETLFAHAEKVRAVTPAFVKEFLVAHDGEADDDAKAARARDADLARIIMGHAAWYVEWPHVDGRFVALFPTLPGFASSR